MKSTLSLTTKIKEKNKVETLIISLELSIKSKDCELQITKIIVNK